MRKLFVWLGTASLLVAACSSSSKILGRPDDAGQESRAGSAGMAHAGTSGAAGSGLGGSAGSAGSAVDGGSDTSTLGTGGSGGSGGTGIDSSAEGGGAGGTAGTGGCILTDVTVDFSTQGSAKLARFDGRGVSVVGIADLQFSGRDAGEPDAGLGVVGGYWDWSIDSSEFVTFTFTRPATNVKIFVTHALDVNHDDVYGKSTVTAYDADGQPLSSFDIAGYGSKNLSALFGDVPISKFMVKDEVDGIAIGSLTFTECLDP